MHDRDSIEGDRALIPISQGFDLPESFLSTVEPTATPFSIYCTGEAPLTLAWRGLDPAEPVPKAPPWLTHCAVAPVNSNLGRAPSFFLSCSDSIAYGHRCAQEVRVRHITKPVVLELSLPLKRREFALT